MHPTPYGKRAAHFIQDRRRLRRPDHVPIRESAANAESADPQVQQRRGHGHRPLHALPHGDGVCRRCAAAHCGAHGECDLEHAVRC